MLALDLDPTVGPLACAIAATHHGESLLGTQVRGGGRQSQTLALLVCREQGALSANSPCFCAVAREAARAGRWHVDVVVEWGVGLRALRLRRLGAAPVGRRDGGRLGGGSGRRALHGQNYNNIFLLEHRVIE
eukprot:scaffold50807_cov28-Tisochrysis_lutea.AAC.1